MNVAVFCASSLPRHDAYIQAASVLGRLIARQGHSLVYGGSNLGLMGAVSGAALAEGGKVTAVIPTLFSEAIIRSQTVSELIRVGSMAERKQRILAMSDAFIALPGGIGTLDEVSEVMVANQLRQFSKPMVLINTDGFYQPFLTLIGTMKEQGMLRSDCGIRVVADSAEALHAISQPQP